MKEKFLIIVFIVLSVLSVFQVSAISNSKLNFEVLGQAAFDENLFSENHNFQNFNDNSSIVFTFGGDVMLSRKINYLLKQADNYFIPFINLEEIFKSADVSMINLESPLVENCPVLNNSTMVFCAEEKFAEILKQAGINYVSFANNHYLDYKKEGYDSTNYYLQQQKIEVINHGEEKIATIKDKKIGFLSYNLTWNNVENQELASKIKNLKSKVDFLIINYHWGEEYQDEPNGYQKEIAHLSIDNGADLIIGHHPHHIQPIEKYNGKYIFYSLGNLVFDQNWSYKTRVGELIKITLNKDNQVFYEIYPTRIDDYINVKVEKNFMDYQKINLNLGKYNYSLAISNTGEKRAKGLSNIELMSTSGGMIFIFDKLDFYYFWMKDMKFPLDFIFIKNNEIVDLLENIAVETYPKSFTSKTKANKVIELNAGEIKKSGIKIGDKLDI